MSPAKSTVPPVYRPRPLRTVVADHRQLMEILRTPGKADKADRNRRRSGSRVDRQVTTGIEPTVPLPLLDQLSQTVMVDGPNPRIQRLPGRNGRRFVQRGPALGTGRIKSIHAAWMTGLLQSDRLGVQPFGLDQTSRGLLCEPLDSHGPEQHNWPSCSPAATHVGRIRVKE
jgi:hypothetical protein